MPFLKQLANPLIAPHIAFYPETDKKVTVTRFSQSQKWRQDWNRHTRTQMVDVVGRHYYIYEPTQLVDSSVVIPCFFWREDLVVKAKCLPLITSKQRGSDQWVLKMLGEPGFDSQSFQSVPVAEFFSPYLDIVTSDGVKLANLSGPVVWRECCDLWLSPSVVTSI